MYRTVSTTARYENSGNPEWEKQSRGWVRDALENFSTSLNEADIVMLRDKIFATHGLHRPGDVLYVADQMLIGWEFTSVQGALERAKQLAPEYYADGEGARREIVKRGREIDINFADPDALSAVIVYLGSKKNPFLPLSELGEQEKRQSEDAAREQLEKDRLIKSITRGKPTYPVWDWEKRDGRIKTFDAAPLVSKNIDELSTILAEVAELRRKRSLTREEQRAELRQTTEARGYKAYRPDEDHNSLSVTTSDRPTTIADRAAEINTGGGESLINRQTGQEYTRPELCAVARNDIELWRSLMRKNLTRFNEILANKGA